MPSSSSAEVPSPLTYERVLVVFSGLVLVMLLAALDSTIVATALPTIVGELGGLAHLSWVVMLTDEGCRVFNRLVAARRERLAELWPEWSPEKREEVARLIRRLAQELVPETTPGGRINSPTGRG